MRYRLCSFLAVALMMNLSGSSGARPGPKDSLSRQSFQSLDDLLEYISDDWGNLKRSLSDCRTYEDVKTEGEPAVYLPAGVANPRALEEMQKQCNVLVKRLPEKITESDASRIRPHGLLYLEHPYIVPGGQFNEMYGWDSYFIIRGLLRSGRRDLAKGMVENFFYEIEHYGGVLNANRTYYLGRSQPPFLTSMILAVYDAESAAGQANTQWLERAYQFAVRDYEQWTREPHLAGDTGLSRYFDDGDGPVPEIMGDPSDYYRGVARYFLLHEGENSPHLVKVGSERQGLTVGPIFELSTCEPTSPGTSEGDCGPAGRFALSADYYKGDRSMRESGFDVTFRFGPYGAETHHFAPVCLNSLLYQTEKDLERISGLLGRESDRQSWAHKASDRRDKMQKYFWNARRGLFFDYDFIARQQSSYEYATTFYPLWTGSASVEQARAVVRNLGLFEQPGGIVMSRFNSKAQWDYPYGWAPVNLLAIEGVERYGYHQDADRITEKFLSMVFDNFRREHTIREKYDVVERSSQTHIGAGYATNETGFGWTNGAFLELLHQSPPELVARLRKE